MPFRVHFRIEAGDADGRDGILILVPDGRGDTVQIVKILAVVNGVAAFAGCLQFFEKLCKVGDGVFGGRWERAAPGNLAYFFRGIASQQGFPQTREMHQIAFSDDAGGPNRRSSFRFIQVDDHAVIFHSQKNGFPGLLPQLFNKRPGDTAEIPFGNKGAPYFKGFDAQLKAFVMVVDIQKAFLGQGI